MTDPDTEESPSLTPTRRDEQARNLLISPESGWMLDYGVMTVLAAVIAGVGMRMDSAPVVIGAMLVAPVMRPVLGTGFACLALVSADAVRRLLVVLAATSVALVAIGWLLATAFPSTAVGLTDEVLARTAPDVRDLIVALAAGSVGAFAVLRPRVSDSIPGVAIAVALVPPPVAAGIALGHSLTEQATGALLLYVTNLVAIILGTIITVLVLRNLGERPFELNNRRLRTTVLIAAVAALGIGVPLYGSFIDAVSAARTERERASIASTRDRLEDLATTELESWIAASTQPNLGIVSISVPTDGEETEEASRTVSVVLLGGAKSSIPPLDGLTDRLSATLDVPTVLSIRLVGVADQVSSLIATQQAQSEGAPAPDSDPDPDPDSDPAARTASAAPTRAPEVTVDGRSVAVTEACRPAGGDPELLLTLAGDDLTIEVDDDRMTFRSSSLSTTTDNVTVREGAETHYRGLFNTRELGIGEVELGVSTDPDPC